MPTKPKIRTLTNSSADILNVIRNNATQNYKNYVPVATEDADSIRKIGAILMDHPSLQNEFIRSIVNRIAMVMITSKLYSNPWAMFKKGKIDFGETVEEIFINLCKPHTYDPEVAESKVFKREIPDVRAAFHVLNYEKFYKNTIQQMDLNKAFLSAGSVTEFIQKVIEAAVTSANYDEFQTMKYMIARMILDGRMHPVTVPAISPSNAKAIVTAVKGMSNDLEFLSDKYNVAGVYNKTEKAKQYIIMNSKFDAMVDVEVLASAFNMNKAEFMGHKVLVDGFGNLDTARLAELFDGDATYEEVSAEEMEALNAIPCVLVDDDWFMIFDNLEQMREQENGEGLYWNYWYHVWKTFSTSPFANALMFIPDTPDVTSITVSPSTADVKAGQRVALTATVTTENFAPQTVTWSSDTEGVEVNESGIVVVGADVAGGTSVTITATSTYKPTVTGEATLTVKA